jgi:hypothetical protein
MTRAATYPDLLYEESLAEGLSTFVVRVVTSLHIMFLERKYLSMLCFSVQIVINITKPVERQFNLKELGKMIRGR